MRLSNKKLKYIKRHAAEESPEEISRALNVPVRAVKKALAKGAGRASSARAPACADFGELGRAAADREPDAQAGQPRVVGLPRLPARVLEGLPFWGLFFLAVAAPFVFVRANYDYANLPKSAFVQAGALAVALSWLVRSLFRRDCRVLRTPFDLPVLGFLGWTLISLVWAHNRYEAFVVWMNWAACGLAFLVTVNTITDDRGIRRLLRGIFVSGLVVALLGILQHLLGLDWIPQSAPPAATFANKNMAAHYVILTLPLGVWLFLTASTRLWEWLVAFACALMCVFLYYTSAKAAWVALAFQIVALSALLLRDRVRLGIRPVEAFGRSKAGAVVSSAVVALVLINLTPEGLRWRGGKALEDMSLVWHTPGDPGEDAGSAEAGAADVRYESSVGVRLALWKNTLVMIREHPLLGVGVGNWTVHYPRYSSRAVLDKSLTGKIRCWRPHNDHLQILAELGLVGMVLYAWLGFAVLRALAGLLGRETRGEMRRAVTSVATGVLGLLVNAFFSFPLHLVVPPLTLMIYLGVLGGALARGSGGCARGRSPRLPGWVLVFGSVVVATVLTVSVRTQYHWLVADQHFREMEFAHADKDWPRVIAEGKKAYEHNSYRKKTLLRVAGAYIRSGRPEKAVPILGDVLRAYPNALKAYNALGVAHMDMGDFDNALAYYKRAIEIRPEYADAYNNIGCICMRQGKIAATHMTRGKAAEALPHFRLAVKYDPQNADYHHNLGIAAFHAGRHSESKEAFERALGLRPGWDIAHKHLGVLLCTALGEKAEGVRHLKSALSLNPKIAEADKIRKMIKLHSTQQTGDTN